MGLLKRNQLVRGSLRRSDSSTSPSSSSDTPATWSTSLVRYFFLDYDAGNDGNLGYIDAAAGTVFTAAAASALAIKTFTRLFQILPRTGNGRSVVILVKNRAAGATYLDADGVTASVVDFSVCSGYALTGVRGSTDLTNSATDKILCGAVTGFAGPNGDGSWTAAAGATVKQLTVAAGSLPAEGVAATAIGSYIGGMRVRFVGDVTPALANVVTMVYRNTSGAGTIEFGQDIASAPAAGDTFFLERVGVRVDKFNDFAGENIRGAASTTGAGGIVAGPGFTVGIATTSTGGNSLKLGVDAFDTHAYGFIECNSSFTDRVGARWLLNPNYADEAGTTRQCGVGLRSQSFGRIAGGGLFSIGARGLFLNGTGLRIAGATRGNIGGACYLGDGLDYESVAVGETGAGVGNTVGSLASATIAPLRIVRSSMLDQGAGGCVVAGQIQLHGIEFQGCTHPCVLVTKAVTVGPPNYVQCRSLVAAAAGGNTNYGISIASSTNRPTNSTIVVEAGVTVSPTLGEIRFETDAVIATYATLSRTNIIDTAGNNVILGSLGSVTGPYLVGPGEVAKVTNSSGGALAVGDLVRKNGTTGQVTSAIADTLANAFVDGVMITSPGSGLVGYMALPGSSPSITFAAAPTAGAIAYLSTTTTRNGTTTEPVLSGTLQKVKLGRVLTVSGNNGVCTFLPDLKPENTFERALVWAEISDAAAAFSATQTALVYTGAITANRAATLEALSTLSVGERRLLADLTTSGAFNISLTPNGTDLIDGVNAAVVIPSGSKQTIVVRKTPTAGWKIE